MTESIQIEGRCISEAEPPYFIAEMSANHNGDFENALKILRSAKESGADAVKLQTYRADTITLNSDLPDFRIENGLWAGKTLYQLYDWAHTPWEWHKPLFDYAKELNLTIFSSPFDHSAVDFLEKLDVPAYKIASFEATDLDLIEYIAQTRKPIILSTGMANLEEIAEAVEVIHSHGSGELAILHCVSGYPAPPEDYNLRTLPDLASHFKTVVGLSDHSLDNATAITAIGLGASIVEKHFTLDRKGGGPDDSFSLEPNDFAQLTTQCNRAYASLGSINYDTKLSEKDNEKFRRSLYFTQDLEAGSAIDQTNIKSVRPGYGLPPKFFKKIVGLTLNQAVAKNSPVKSCYFDQL